MSNRFEKQSKLTLFLVLSLSLLLLLVLFEMLLGYTLGKNQADTRHIRLRENAPHLSLHFTPSASELKRSENLEKKSYAFETDKDGFLLPSLSHEKADLTLAFIGGSTTECMYVDADKRFPYLTGTLLNTGTRKVNTINAGVSGNNSLNSINAYLNKIVPKKPDIAVLMHNINDLATLLHEKSYWNNNEFRSPLVNEDKSVKSFVKSSLPNSFELLYKFKTVVSGPVDEFASGRNKIKTPNKKRIYDLFEDNLNIFISISKAKGIEPVLMTQASRFTENPDRVVLESFKVLESLGINYQQFKQLFDGMNNRIRKVAADNNIVLIDLAKEIPPSSDYIVDTVHFNQSGSERVASYISKQLATIEAVKNSQ